MIWHMCKSFSTMCGTMWFIWCGLLTRATAYELRPQPLEAKTRLQDIATRNIQLPLRRGRGCRTRRYPCCEDPAKNKDSLPGHGGESRHARLGRSQGQGWRHSGLVVLQACAIRLLWTVGQ